MVKARAGAIIIQNSNLAIRHRLLAMYPFRTFTDAGGVIVYGPDFADLLRRAAPTLTRS
jgi:hypothetical protein